MAFQGKSTKAFSEDPSFLKMTNVGISTEPGWLMRSDGSGKDDRCVMITLISDTQKSGTRKYLDIGLPVNEANGFIGALQNTINEILKREISDKI